MPKSPDDKSKRSPLKVNDPEYFREIGQNMEKVVVLKATYTNTLKEYYVREFNIECRDDDDKVLKTLQEKKDLEKETLIKNIKVLKSTIEESPFCTEKIRKISQSLADIDAWLTQPESNQVSVNIPTKSFYNSPNSTDDELEGRDDDELESFDGDELDFDDKKGHSKGSFINRDNNTTQEGRGPNPTVIASGEINKVSKTPGQSADNSKSHF
jgi:hypothetical protein